MAVLTTKRAVPVTLPRITAASLARWLLLLLVIFMVLGPITSVMLTAFRGVAPGWGEAQWGIRGFREAYGNPELVRVMWTSIWLAAVRTALAATLAVVLAWIIARTDTPFTRFFEWALWIGFFLPPFAIVLGYTLLMAPNQGLFNVWLRALPFVDQGPFNIYSFGGIIWVSILGWGTVLTLFLLPAFRSMDASLEESARMSGATTFGTLRKVTAPLLRPAVLAVLIIAFVAMVGSFETEVLLGIPAGIHVFTTKIWEFLAVHSPPYHDRAAALAFTLLTVCFAVVAIQWKLLGSRSYTTVSGRGFRARPMELGRWRWLTFAFLVAFFLVSVVVPLIVTIITSFLRLPGVWGVEDQWTLNHYRQVTGLSYFWPTIKNSLIMSIGAATAGMFLYSLIAYTVTKTRFEGRRALDLLVWLPWAVPGLVMGLGLLWFTTAMPFLRILYQTIWVLIFVQMIRGFPIGTRIMTSTMVQVNSELEESARIHGATWTKTFLRIWLPLLRGGFVTGWIFMFAVAFRNLDIVVMLYGPESRVLSTVFFDFFRSGWLGQAAVIGLITSIVLTVVVMVVRKITPGARFETTATAR